MRHRRPTPPRAPPRATPARSEVEELREKYAALSRKHASLVHEDEAEAIQGSSVTLLALAAMRASATAVATIRDGRCLVRNQRWLRIASTPDAWRGLGARPDDGTPARSLEELALDQAAKLLGSPRVTHVERLERREGTVVELRLERARVEPPLVLAMITDVSAEVRRVRELERMRTAMEAQERLRAVGELASGIAHDLNNTLHALQLRLSRLRACVAGCGEHTEDLRVVERIASDAAARVRRLQDLARRREDVPDERVDLRAVIANAVELARPHDPDPALHLTIEVALPPLPPVVGDSVELGHVFVSLLLNGKDAMPRGGRIVVTGSVGGDGAVEIQVADEGTGIPAENLERIFDPFFTTKGRRGTGLGLSMAAGVMRRLGGDIRAGNRPGGGATFTLRFPRDPAPRPARSPRAVQGPTTPRRVLVVDDDPDNLDAMQLVLAQQGHHVEVTDSGLDAVARVEAGERYDVVLCDLGLGDTTGWEVAARLAAIAPSTRVALVTGWAEEIAPDDPRRRHVARVLAKPLDVDDLRAVLHELGAREAPPSGASASPGSPSPEDDGGGERASPPP
jgi:signal transduction histidine kinase/ActR/RegA family two-component response regulator